MSLVETLLLAAGTSLFGLMLYAAGGGYIPFLAALSSLRVSTVAGAVRLNLLDAGAMSATGMVVWALPGLAMLLGWLHALVTAALLALLWSSFRLQITAFADHTVVERRVLWRLRYLQVTRKARARLVVDGWGDMADPEALVLHVGEGLEYELGWSGAKDGDKAQQVADQFNAHLDALI